MSATSARIVATARSSSDPHGSVGIDAPSGLVTTVFLCQRPDYRAAQVARKSHFSAKWHFGFSAAVEHLHYARTMTAFDAPAHSRPDTTAEPQKLTAQALLLDMDGTLVDSDAAVYRVWEDWANRNGFDPATVFHLAHGRQGQETMAELLPNRPHEVNLAENEALLAAEHADVEGVIEIAGASEFLAALRDLPHALVTSADRLLMERRMGAAGLDAPTVRVTAEDVSASKPDPEGFLRAAKLLGVDPAACIVFEDSKAGIAAGRAAGMRVVGVGPRAAEHDPTIAVNDLTRVVVTKDPEGVAILIGD